MMRGCQYSNYYQFRGNKDSSYFGCCQSLDRDYNVTLVIKDSSIIKLENSEDTFSIYRYLVGSFRLMLTDKNYFGLIKYNANQPVMTLKKGSLTIYQLT
jgi:hypothetical protein